MGFLTVINEAQRHFKKETGNDADIVFLTARGIDCLWQCIHGCNPYRLAKFKPLQSGDSVMGFTIYLDINLPYGFRLSSSSLESNIYYTKFAISDISISFLVLLKM